MWEKLIWVVWVSKAGAIVVDDEKDSGGHGDHNMQRWYGDSDNRNDNGGGDDDNVPW